MYSKVTKKDFYFLLRKREKSVGRKEILGNGVLLVDCSGTLFL
jgi:hypothetical protein